MTEKLKPAYEAKIYTHEEPIKGVLIWHPRRNPAPIKGTLVASRYQEYARVAIWHPLLENPDGQIAGDTPMEEVYVPYMRFAEMRTQLNNLKQEHQALLEAQGKERGDTTKPTS